MKSILPQTTEYSEMLPSGIAKEDVLKTPYKYSIIQYSCAHKNNSPLGILAGITDYVIACRENLAINPDMNNWHEDAVFAVTSFQVSTGKQS